MTNRKKIIIGTGLVLSSATLTAAVSCGTSEGLDKLANQRIFRISRNTVYLPNAFPYERSAAYGSGSWPVESSTEVKLVTIKNVGQPQFENNTQRDQTTGELSITSTKILKPTVWSYELTAADAVVLVMKDGTEMVFDSDDDEIKPTATIDGKYFQQASEKASSNNDKSINSKKFDEALRKAHKLSFRMRQDIYWVDYKGNKTEFKMEAEDYYVGYLRTLMYDANFRHSNGGSASMDKEVIKLLQNARTNFGDNSQYGNGYLIDLYGVDNAKLLNKQNFITKKESHEYVNFEATAGVEPKLDLMFGFITVAGEWTPAPSAYIKSKSGSGTEQVISQKAATTSSELDSVKTEVKKATGFAKDTGYYWYGTNFENTLFAGKYYYNNFDTTTNTLSLLKNDNYWDKKFVDDKTTLLRIEIKYQRKALTGTLFEEQVFNNYQAGDVSTFRFVDQPASNQQTIRKQPDFYGLTFDQSFNKNNVSSIKQVFWNFIPDVPSATYRNATPATNEVYEKLMWNSDKSEDITNGTLNGATAIKASTTGYGLAFRSILTAAINWNEITNLSFSGVSHRPWLVALAPDANIGGSDQITSKFKTPLDGYDMLNTLFAVNQEGNKLNLTSVSKNEITPENNISLLASAGANARTRSAAYAELKTAMKDLLDKFYSENPTFAGKKVEFVIRNDFRDLSNTKLTAHKAATDLINSLDTRIDATYKNVTDANLFDHEWRVGRKPAVIYRWGYDWEGIGSGFDARSWNNQGIVTFLGILSNDEAYKATVKKSFPEMVKAAEKFKAYTDALPYKLSIPLSDWSKLTIEQLSTFRSKWLGTHEYNSATKELKELSDSSKKHPNGGAISASFWLDFQTKTTNEELLAFAREVAILFGINPNDSQYIAETNFSEVVSNPNYVVPYSSGNWNPLSDIRIKIKHNN